MRELRLRNFHEVSGAVFQPEAGWDVPASYSPLPREVRAARGSGGVIDFSNRAKIAVTGTDRVSFLDGLMTCDVRALSPGRLSYGLVLTDQARVVGDFRVYAFEDRFVLDIEASQKETLLRHLDRFLVSDDVVFEDLGACGHLEVHGPLAANYVKSGVGVDVRGSTPGDFRIFSADKHHAGYAGRTNPLGLPAISVWSPGMDLEVAWISFQQAGADPLGRDAYEVLRIESGVPKTGTDMGEDTLALEVAPDGAISYTKGCYVGQEVVARGTYRGHVRRKLMGLKVDGDTPPVHGDLVTRPGGGEVGRVTSATWSPTTGWVVALALLRVDDVNPSATLFVDRDGWDLRARLHPLPFVRVPG